MRSISWLEKYSALNVYSKKAVVLLTGFCSGFLLVFIALSFIYPMIKSFPDMVLLYWKFFYVYLLLFGFIGMFSSLVVLANAKKDWEDYGLYNYRDIFSYWLFFLGIWLCGNLFFLNIPKISMVYVWFGPIFFALILSDFLRYLWRTIHCRILLLFFSKDYECIVNEKKFKDYLRLKFSEVKRYGGPFSVIAIAVDHNKKVKQKYGHKILIKLNDDIIGVLDQNTRETDIFGRIADGTVVISFANTGRENISGIGHRMLDIVRGRTFIYSDKIIKTTISLGIGILNPKFKTPEDVINAAVDAINEARQKGAEQIVCNDGEIHFI